MALPASTFVTYQAVGNREDLSDMIYRIDPTDTPFMSAAEKEKATAVNHEWQTQALAPASSANAQLEGDDATTTATTPTVRLGNLCQISYKVARVSGTQQAVDHAGRDNELAYQEMLKGLELKRDIETILVGTNQAKVVGFYIDPQQQEGSLDAARANRTQAEEALSCLPVPDGAVCDLSAKVGSTVTGDTTTTTDQGSGAGTPTTTTIVRGNLPETGASSGSLVPFGLLVFGMGVLTLLLSRRPARR